MLTINLFGPGQARFADRSLNGFPTQQASLLFCYLLLNREHPHYRERLATQFWEDHPTHIARKYLRNTLWRLRSTLEEAGAESDSYLWISDDSVAFAHTSPYWLDVEEFERGTAPYQEIEGEDLTSDQAEQIENALDLYRGDLLESVYEDWCLYDRERLRLAYFESLGKLMGYHGAQGSWIRGLHFGERILALDSAQEKVHRQMMWLHWQSGNRGAALAQYTRCVQVLREEFGVSPMRETQQLNQQMVRNEFDPERWPLPKPTTASERLASANPAQTLAMRIRQKLQGLQHMVEEVNTEIYTLEQLLDTALGDVEQ